MRPLLLTPLLALSLGLFAAHPASAQETKTVRETLRLPADGVVEVSTHAGSVVVNTWDRPEVELEVRIESAGDDALVAATEIDIRQSGRRLLLATDYEKARQENSGLFGLISAGNYRLPLTHYQITMPHTARLVISDHESEIQVTGLRAPLDITTHEGAVTVGRLEGDLDLSTHEGRVAVDQLRGDLDLNTHEGHATIDGLEGRLDLNTHEGTITARGVSGPVDLSTHEGDITLQDVRGDVEVSTHDGRIEITGLAGALDFSSHDGTGRVAFARLDSDVSATTHDGDLELMLPAGAGFVLEAELGDDARLEADFDLANLLVSEDENDYYGTVGSGGPRLRLAAHDGRFALRTR